MAPRAKRIDIFSVVLCGPRLIFSVLKCKSAASEGVAQQPDWMTGVLAMLL